MMISTTTLLRVGDCCIRTPKANYEKMAVDGGKGKNGLDNNREKNT